MKTISEKLLQALESNISSFFGDMTEELLGITQKLDKGKRITFTTKPQGLVSLFFKGLNDSKIARDEKDTLSVLLRIATGYVDALKLRTQSNILSSLNGYLTEDNVKSSKIKLIVDKEMDKAKKHFELISNAESNKITNTGTALQISRIAKAKNEDDPTIFFVVTQDDKTGFFEYILHLLPDRKTPRLWKLSEVQADYYKPGGQYPSLAGLHVNCRCKITYLADGYGFDKDGKVKFIGLDHDEFKVQREKYGLPNVPQKAKKRKGEWVISYDEIQKAEQDNPRIDHIANNGQKVWSNKFVPWNRQLRTPQEMDNLQRFAWKRYSQNNNIAKGTPLYNTMVNLNKHIINDNDRHLRVSGVHNNPDLNHTEMRQRHLLRAMGGDEGYSIDEVKHPETGEHQGVRIKAPRHHKDGNLGETSWFFNGKSLKTEYNKILPKKWY